MTDSMNTRTERVLNDLTVNGGATVGGDATLTGDLSPERWQLPYRERVC